MRSRVRGNQAGVNWQGIVDTLVLRYSERIESLAEASDGSFSDMQVLIKAMTNTFIDYDGLGTEHDQARAGIRTCTARHLIPALARIDW